MFVVNHASESGTRVAYNVAEVPTVSLITTGDKKGISIGQSQVTNESDNENLVERFDDMIEALASDVKAYDMDKPIGAWKPKKTTHKAAPKPKAEPKKESA